MLGKRMDCKNESAWKSVTSMKKKEKEDKEERM
jgi:hypothetical protein